VPKKKIHELCARQDEIQRDYLKWTYSMDVENPKVYGPREPATAAMIKAGEKYWGLPYPPSYRSFLQRANGWLRFGGGWSLVGTPGPASKDEFAWVKKSLAQVKVVATAEEQTKLAEREKRNPREILPMGHIVIGTDYNFGLLLFDRHRVSRSGEPEVVRTRYAIHVDKRWKNFEAFLKDLHQLTAKHLARMKKDLRSKLSGARERRGGG
jgi:hypothetical protein